MTEKLIIQSYLQGEELDYCQTETENGKSSFLFSISSAEGMVNGVIGLNEIDYQCHLFLMYPMPATIKRFPEVAELITRINNDYMFGAFTMDYNDGFIHFQSSFWYDPDSGFFRKLLDKYFSDSLSLVFHYFLCIKEVAFTNVEPVRALNLLDFNCDPNFN